MSGSERPRAGHLTALASLGVSGVLFVTALLGIASIDPAARADVPASSPALRSISLQEHGSGGGETARPDCPRRGDHRGRESEPDRPIT